MTPCFTPIGLLPRLFFCVKKTVIDQETLLDEIDDPIEHEKVEGLGDGWWVDGVSSPGS